MALGSLIRKRREELKYTLDDVSNRTGYSKPYLSTIETGRVKNPPADDLLVRLEKLLGFDTGMLVHFAHLEKLPADVREEYENSVAENEYWRSLIQQMIDAGDKAKDLLRSTKVRKILKQPLPTAKTAAQKTAGKAGKKGAAKEKLEKLPIAGKLVPIINSVVAGYPADYDDMGYPPGGADDYVRSPDLHDPNAFAVRVVGDSMEPKYHEGDIVVFSPAADVDNGDDCFVRLTDPHETTFKQVFFEEKDQIRLQPRNNMYAPMILPREKVNGIWRAVIRYERLNN